MNLGKRRVAALCAAVCCGFAGELHAQVNVTTYHNDTARTGQNTQETILTPRTSTAAQFGKSVFRPVDGVVYAQPLYLSRSNIAGGTHNVLYVATEHDSVYAIDADVGTVYVQVSLIPSGGTTVNSSSDLGCKDLFRKWESRELRSSTQSAGRCTSSRNRKSTAASCSICMRSM